MAKEEDDKDQGSAKKEEIKKLIKDTTEDAKRIVEQSKDVTLVFSRVGEFEEMVGTLADDLISDDDVEKHHGFWTGLSKTTSEVAGKIQLLVSDTGYPSTASGTVFAYSNTIETEDVLLELELHPFHEFVLNMRQGEIGRPFEFGDSLYIVEVIERNDSAALTADQARPYIEEILVHQEHDQLSAQLQEELLEQANLVIYRQVLEDYFEQLEPVDHSIGPAP